MVKGFTFARVQIQNEALLPIAVEGTIGSSLVFQKLDIE